MGIAMLNPSYALGTGLRIAQQITLFRREQGKRQDLLPFSQVFDIPVDKLRVVHPTDVARRVDDALSIHHCDGCEGYLLLLVSIGS